MSPVVIDEEGGFIISGRLKERAGEKIDLAENVRKLLELFRVLGNQYGKFMRGDHKLIGQEKANLNQIVEEITGILILLRFFLANEILETLSPHCINRELGYDFTMVRENYDFTIRGNISVKLFNQMKDFKSWYTGSFSDRFRKLFQDLRISLADNRISKEEVGVLNGVIDEMLNSLFIMNCKLSRFAIET